MSGSAIDEEAFAAVDQTLAEHRAYLRFHEYRFRKIIGWATDHHQQPGRALDVGCWPGYLSLYLKRTGWEVDAIDLKPDRVQEVRQSGVRINGRNLNQTPELPYDDHSFDLIIFTEILEHLDPASVPSLITEFERALKPGGTIILTTPNRFSLNRQNLNPFRWKTPEVDAEGHGHWLEYRLSQVEALFHPTGLELVLLDPVSFYAHLGRSKRDGYFPLREWRLHSGKIASVGKHLLRLPRAIPWLKDSLVCIAKKPAA
jgi:2-polyprenyl-3-methyl-5-hydroxy-6-metoxy-1,4-benzoquinol methylase